jgi:retron-type reverse transcriptase
VDGQCIEDFDRELSKNLYRIWNRMSSGCYFPPPVRRVDIPKGDVGGTRPLGIPTVSDRIAQMVVKRHLEPILEPVFHRDSYGYRRGRSAHDALIKPGSVVGLLTGYSTSTSRVSSMRLAGNS